MPTGFKPIKLDDDKKNEIKKYVKSKMTTIDLKYNGFLYTGSSKLYKTGFPRNSVFLSTSEKIAEGFSSKTLARSSFQREKELPFVYIYKIKDEIIPDILLVDVPTEKMPNPEDTFRNMSRMDVYNSMEKFRNLMTETIGSDAEIHFAKFMCDNGLFNGWKWIQYESQIVLCGASRFLELVGVKIGEFDYKTKKLVKWNFVEADTFFQALEEIKEEMDAFTKEEVYLKKLFL